MRALRVPRLRTFVLVALFAAGVAQGWRFRPLERPVFADDQLYFFIAERAASGVPPHVSLVDHKHQLAALVSAAAIAVGRIVGADDVFSARLASIVVAAAVVPMLCMLGESLTGSFAAGVAAAACALTFKMFFVEAATGFRTQLFMTFFAVAALLAYARGRHGAAGALAACAFLSWQPAIAIGSAVTAAALFEPWPFWSARRVVLGGAAVLLAYEAYFAAHGALREQLYQSYFMGKLLHVPPVTDTVLFFVRGDPIEMRWRPDAVFAGLLLVTLVAVWLFAAVRPRAAWAAWKRSRALRAVLLAAHGAVVFTFLDHQAYPDRFFFLPYAALTAAVVVALVPQRLVRVPSRALASVALSAWMLSFVPDLVRASNPLAGTLAGQREAARQLVATADARGGGLWVVGRPDLLAFEHRTNWTSFGMLLDEHVREYAQRSSGARGPYRPLRGGRMPDMVFTARIPGARRNLPWLFTRYEKAEIDGLTSVHGQLFVKKSKLLTAARATPAVQCGDPIGDRFSVGGVAIGRPPTATDALYLLKAVLAGKTCQPCVCDVDGSGVVEAVDALRLLKLASGEKVELRCPPCRPGPVQQAFERSKRTSPRPKTVVVQPEPTGARTRVK